MYSNLNVTCRRILKEDDPSILLMKIMLTLSLANDDNWKQRCLGESLAVPAH